MSYVFDPDTLENIVKVGLDATSPDAAMDAITVELANHYPGHIETGPRDWIMNNAGGAMGQMALLHASLSEYVLFFGSPIGTEGHSGRYATEVYDWVFDGEMWCFKEGETARSSYRQGKRAFLGADRVKGYRIPDRAWMLEYSRGPIPTMLPFGMADTLLSTLDLKCIRRTVGTYAKLVVGSLARGKI